MRPQTQPPPGGAAFECVWRGSSSSRPLLTSAASSATADLGPRGFEFTFSTTSNGFEVSTASHHSPAPAHEDIRSAAAARAQVEIYETLALRRAFRALRDSFPHRSIVPLATAPSRGRARHDAICNGCVKPPLHARVRPPRAPPALWYTMRSASSASVTTARRC